MNQTPTVYVGIVTYNSAKIIENCIQKVLCSTYSPIQITLLDNCSSDSISKVMKKYSKIVTYIQNLNNVGFGQGHNKIIQSVPIGESDYYLALNPDVSLDPQYISFLVASCQKNFADWAVGKLYKNRNQKILYSVGHAMFRDGYAFNIGYDLVDNGQYNVSRAVFGAPGAAALYKGSFVRRLSREGNFFDPNLFMYYEDVDVDWRGQLAEKTCWYEPRAVAEHTGATLSPALVASSLANRFLTVVKNAPLLSLITYNLPIILLHIVLRLIVSPRIGLIMVIKVFQNVGAMLIQRTAHKKDISDWFLRAKTEVSGQPQTVVSRLLSFVGYE